jgi:isoquinoline 1-oxidoreductase beta subunit
MMNVRIDPALQPSAFALIDPVNLSRRRFLTGTAVGALVLGFGLPLGSASVQAAATAERGTAVGRSLTRIFPEPFSEAGAQSDTHQRT